MSLAQKAVRGAAWTIATSLGSRALGLVGTLVVTRFIDPGAYGEVMAASIYTVLANQFSTVGVGQYVIAKQKAGREVVWHATVVHLALGAIAFAIAYALRGPMGPRLGAPDMARYVPGLTLSVLLDRVAFMPERILVRDMRFRVVGLTRTVGEFVYSVASVALAAAGWGAMAIVLANIARSAVRCAVFVAAAKRDEWLTPSSLDPAIARDLFRFGLPLWIGASSGFASRRVDNLLFTRFFGDAAAGMYNIAYNLADIPAVTVGEQIGDVLLPSFAQMDERKRKGALVRSTTLLGLIMFPLAIGLGAIAPTAVHACFDRRWAQVAPMLMYLSALSVTRPIGWTIASYLQARDRPGAVMALEVFKVVALVGAICTLGRWSQLATCVAVGVAFGAHALLSLWVVKLLDGVSLARTLLRLVPPLVACVPMVAAVLGVRFALARLGLHGVAGKIVPLAAETTAGAIAYVLSALVVARSASRELLELLRRAIANRRAPQSPAKETTGAQ